MSALTFMLLYFGLRAIGVVLIVALASVGIYKAIKFLLTMVRVCEKVRILQLAKWK